MKTCTVNKLTLGCIGAEPTFDRHQKDVTVSIKKFAQIVLRGIKRLRIEKGDVRSADAVLRPCRLSSTQVTTQTSKLIMAILTSFEAKRTRGAV